MKKAFVVVLAVFITLTFTASVFAGGKGETAMEAKYQIGIVFDIAGRGDQSFNDSAYNGLVLLAEEFKGYIKDDPDKVDFGKEVEMKYLTPKPGGQDREILLRSMAEDGYDLVIGVGFMFSDSLGRVAADFPDVHFGLIDGFIPDLTADSNVTVLSFAEHEGSFLMGVVAALMRDGGKVGFIGGMDIPLIHKFQGGFMAGAMYADPALRDKGMILAQYCGKEATAFNDPKTAESIATNFFNQGANIIYHAAGGSGDGLFKAAKDLDKLAIGVDSDQGLIYASQESAEAKSIAEHIVTSMLKRVDISVFMTGKELIENGEVKGGYHAFGLVDEGVGVAENQYNKAKLAPIKAKVDEIKAKIIAGEITVPDDDSKVDAWAAKTF